MSIINMVLNKIHYFISLKDILFTFDGSNPIAARKYDIFGKSNYYSSSAISRSFSLSLHTHSRQVIAPSPSSLPPIILLTIGVHISEGDS